MYQKKGELEPKPGEMGAIAEALPPFKSGETTSKPVLWEQNALLK